MTVRRIFFAACSLLGLWLLGGCGAGESASFLPPETEDSDYRAGQQFEREGRYAEALNAYLKAIDRRGVSRSPESHLQVAAIYSNKDRIPDPYEAVHYFRKYIEYAAPSLKVTLAREQMDAAKRETLQSMPGRPFEEQSVQLNASEQIARLQRENNELRAQLQAIRGNAPLPVPRSAPAAGGSPFGASPSPFPTSAGGAGGTSSFNGSSGAGGGGISFPGAGSAAAAPAAGAQKGSVQKTGAQPLPAGSKRHTIQPKDNLSIIARQYYGNASAQSLLAIQKANPSLIPNVNTLPRIGTEIVIPPKP